MNYTEICFIFMGLFIAIFLIDYFFINKPKLKASKTKKAKKNKNLSELDYLILKFHLNPNKINKGQVIVMIALINSFIISFVSCLIMFLPLKLIWQLIIAFALLFSLIYALYEIYGHYLKKKEEKRK